MTGYSLERSNVAKTYDVKFNTEQGVDNWFYYEYGEYCGTELVYDSNKEQWVSATADYPNITQSSISPGDTDAGYRFIAPDKGMICLKGTAVCPWEDSAKGNGVILSIIRGQNVIWSQELVYGNTASYDINLSVRKGETLDFRVNCNGNRNYDWTQWRPIVEYLNQEYIPDAEEYTYYEKNDNKTTTLSYSNEKDGYVSLSGNGFISSSSISLSDDTVLGRSYTVSNGGRYCVNAEIVPDNTDGNTVITVLKNQKTVWKQMFPNGERGILDIRIFSEQGDVIDTEVSIESATYTKTVEWNHRVTKYIGTMFCSADTSKGYSSRICDLVTLTDVAADSNTEFYSIKNDKKFPMIYNGVTQRCESSLNDGGYVAKESAFPGNDSDSVMEWTVDKNGTVRFSGDMRVSLASDGVVSKIIHNGNVIWSSRVGGERPVRWDEPFDVSYFLNKVNVTAMVESGDKLAVLFNRWRKTNNDTVNFNNVSYSYIEGEVFSATTKRKLKESIIVDVKTGKFHKGKTIGDIDAFENDGTVYVAKQDTSKLFGTETNRSGRFDNGIEYVPLEDVAEDSEKNYIWAANRAAIVYDGIPVLFGWAELSEINTVLNPIYEVSEPVNLEIVDEKGNEAESAEINKTYYVKLSAENYVGDDTNIQVLIAQYDENSSLKNISLEKELKVPTGTVLKLNQNRENVSLIRDTYESGTTPAIPVSGVFGDSLTPQDGSAAIVEQSDAAALIYSATAPEYSGDDNETITTDHDITKLIFDKEWYNGKVMLYSFDMFAPRAANYSFAVLDGDTTKEGVMISNKGWITPYESTWVPFSKRNSNWFDNYNGGGWNSAGEIGGFEFGKWNRVTMISDIENNVFYLYLNDNLVDKLNLNTLNNYGWTLSNASDGNGGLVIRTVDSWSAKRADTLLLDNIKVGCLESFDGADSPANQLADMNIKLDEDFQDDTYTIALENGVTDNCQLVPNGGSARVLKQNNASVVSFGDMNNRSREIRFGRTAKNGWPPSDTYKTNIPEEVSFDINMFKSANLSITVKQDWSPKYNIYISDKGYITHTQNVQNISNPVSDELMSIFNMTKEEAKLKYGCAADFKPNQWHNIRFVYTAGSSDSEDSEKKKCYLYVDNKLAGKLKMDWWGRFDRIDISNYTASKSGEAMFAIDNLKVGILGDDELSFVPQDGVSEIKVFAWNNLGEFNPIAKPVTVSVEK